LAIGKRSVVFDNNAWKEVEDSSFKSTVNTVYGNDTPASKTTSQVKIKNHSV
jgi:hypothetical protein